MAKIISASQQQPNVVDSVINSWRAMRGRLLREVKRRDEMMTGLKKEENMQWTAVAS